MIKLFVIKPIILQFIFFIGYALLSKSYEYLNWF